MSPKKLADLMKARRKALDMTQEEIASKAGIARGYLAKLETGAAANPSVDTLRKIAKALKLDAGDLLK